MVSAHHSGPIFADLVTCPYYFMGEESINPFQPKSSVLRWANYPQLCDPSLLNRKQESIFSQPNQRVEH